MTQRGRHARTKLRGWGSEPARQNQLADAIASEERDPTKRSPGRKDRKNHCRTLRGPHNKILTIRHIFHTRTELCGWGPVWDRQERTWTAGWNCYHQEECSGCGKWFRFIANHECPDLRVITDQERKRVEGQIAELLARLEARAAKRRKPIVGRQSFRRRRNR